MILQKIDRDPEELAQASISFHELACEAEKLARSLRREADRLADERKEDDVKRIVIDKASYEQGDPMENPVGNRPFHPESILSPTIPVTSKERRSGRLPRNLKK